MRLSPKQRDAILGTLDGGARVNVLHGSVRSGKTMSSIVAWCEFVRSQAPEGRPLVMIGKTKDTLRRNVLDEIDAAFGKASPLVHTPGANEGRLFGRTIRQAVLAATADTAAGVQTRRDAAQQVLNGLAQSGITGYVSPGGRSYDLATYTESATRTALARGSRAAHHGRLIERGYDLVRISNSPDECPQCRPWEGKVVSLTGATPGYPTLADAERAGYGHPNCTHSEAMFIPGVTKALTNTANPQGYEDRQRLRYLEREARKADRAADVALDKATKQKAERRRALLSERIREHTETTGQKRQRHRERAGAAR